MEHYEWIALSMFLLLLSTMAAAAYLFGLFHKVIVQVGKPPFDLGGKTIAYKLDRGSYKLSGHKFTEVLGDFIRVAPQLDVPMIGFYYDQPGTVEEHKLRYAVGLIMPNDIDGSILKDLESAGFSLSQMPQVDHVVWSTFPYLCAFSITIATMKVYPEMESYCIHHKLCARPCLEVYDGGDIHFIRPLSKQDSFNLFDDDDEEEEVEVDDGDDEGSAGSSDDSNSEDEYGPRNQDPESGPSSEVKIRRRKPAQSSSRKASSVSSSFEQIPSMDGDHIL